jgi:uncharacterized protein Usg
LIASSNLLKSHHFLLRSAAGLGHAAFTKRLPETLRGAAEQKDTDRMLIRVKDYRLTTAEILYHIPDHPAVLQSYIWQDMDIAPQYPALRKFLNFWQREIEGRLHSVRVGTSKLTRASAVRHAGAMLTLH